MKAEIQVVKFRLGRGDLQRRNSLSLLFDLTSVHFNQWNENMWSVKAEESKKHIQKHSFIQSLLCDITITFYYL